MIDFLRNRIGSGRATSTHVLQSTNSLESSTYSFESVLCDTTLSVNPGSTHTSSASPVEEWNYDEVQTFLRNNGFEKFLSILPANADGSDLCYLYSMCVEGKNKTFEKINEADPNIKLSGYLAFVKALRNLVKEMQMTN